MPPTTKAGFQDVIGVAIGAFIGELGLASGATLQSLRLREARGSGSGPILFLQEDGGRHHYIVPWASVTYLRT